MIYEGSRYEYSDVVRTVGADGRARLSVLSEDRSPTSSYQYSIYVVKEGDRIDVIAHRFLGDAERWWVIADHNPEWFWYEQLPVGLSLRIPNV